VVGRGSVLASRRRVAVSAAVAVSIVVIIVPVSMLVVVLSVVLLLLLALLVELVEHLLGLLHDLDQEELGSVLRLGGAGGVEDLVGGLNAKLAKRDLGLDKSELVVRRRGFLLFSFLVLSRMGAMRVMGVVVVAMMVVPVCGMVVVVPRVVVVMVPVRVSRVPMSMLFVTVGWWMGSRRVSGGVSRGGRLDLRRHLLGDKKG